MYIFLCEHKFSFPWGKCPRVQLFCHIVVLSIVETTINFLVCCQNGFQTDFNVWKFLSVMDEWSCFSTFLPARTEECYHYLKSSFSYCDRCVVISHQDFNFFGDLFICLFAICIFSLVEGLSVSFAHFIIGSLFNVSFKKYFSSFFIWH